MRANTYRAAILLLAVAVSKSSPAQQVVTPGTLSFEVASVKVNKSGPGAASLDFTPDRVRISNAPLVVVLMKAHNIYRDQQLSSPAAVRSLLGERYDIDAKAAHPVSSPDMLRMLQSLLTDRFKLAMHSETKEVAGYVLVVDSARHKLRQHVGAAGECSIRGGKGGEFRFENCAMDYVAGFFLSNVALKPVADKTELKGGYDFELTFNIERAANPGESRPEATVVNPESPSLFDAIRQQLGLRLRAEKVNAEFFSIDHIEKPSEN